MGPFELLAKIIGITGRVGAALALTAFCVFLLHRPGEPLANLDSTFYQTIVVLGILGACTVVVEFALVVGRIANLVLSAKVDQWQATSAERHQRREMAFKNLRSMPMPYADTLLWLKAKNWKRFPAGGQNDLLYQMSKASLLEIDDPNWTAYSVNTYYQVPDYVWDAIDSFDEVLKARPISAHPPWERRPDPQGWMR